MEKPQEARLQKSGGRKVDLRKIRHVPGKGILLSSVETWNPCKYNMGIFRFPCNMTKVVWKNTLSFMTSRSTMRTMGLAQAYKCNEFLVDVILYLHGS